MIRRRAGELPGPVVSYVDQALLLARAAGQDAVMQSLWILDGPADLAFVASVRGALADAPISRLIAPSPLPFGRPRWVRAPAPTGDLDVATRPRPAEDLFDWADEQVDLPLDPVAGPPWRIAVLPLADGRTAVSMVVSHCVGAAFTARDAVGQAVESVAVGAGAGPVSAGGRDEVSVAAARRSAVVRADLRQAVADLPAVVRAVGRALRLLVASRPGRRGGARPAPEVGTGLVTMPTAVASVDLAVWDERAAALGGTPTSLLTAVAVRLAEGTGRVRNGRVHLLVSLLNDGDGEGGLGAAIPAANAVTLARVEIDPAAADDHDRLRAVVRAGIATARRRPDPMLALLPLIPFVPRRLVGALGETVFGFADDRPVNFGSLGVIPVGYLGIGGFPARWLCTRGVDRKVSAANLARRGGVLTVTASVVGGSMAITVVAADPTRPGTRADLRRLLADVLDGVGVTAEFR